MSNDYFDTADFTAVTRNTRALAEAVMAIAAAIEAGFDLFPSNLSIRQGKVTFVASDTGTVNAHLVSMQKTPPAYSDGLQVIFRAGSTNTGAATVNVDSLGVKDVRNYAGAALTGGEIVANAMIALRYDANGGYFRIENPLTAVASVTSFDIDGLSADTDPDDGDYAAIHSQDASGKRKVTLQNLLLVGWSVASSVDPTADYVLIYDASAGALKKVLVSNVADEGNLILASQVFGRR